MSTATKVSLAVFAGLWAIAIVLTILGIWVDARFGVTSVIFWFLGFIGGIIYSFRVMVVD